MHDTFGHELHISPKEAAARQVSIANYSSQGRKCEDVDAVSENMEVNHWAQL